MIKILAFETSCDDTSVAIVNQDYTVDACLTSSQFVHNEYGGVVPEIASRLHLKNILPLTEAVLNRSGTQLKEIDAIAVSINPGLIGSLLVGLSFAKGLAFSLRKPLIAINHIVGHIAAVKLSKPNVEPPYLALIASGGHTELVDFYSNSSFKIIGRTRDDAAGEAFDKTAKLLGLGYPGGPIIDKLARKGNPKFHRFPRGLNKKGEPDFSYSGLKTSIMNYLEANDNKFIEQNIENIAASVQDAIIEPLIKKTLYFAKKLNRKQVLIAGGVSANSRLREQFEKKTKPKNLKLLIPELKYCMDNAAMIGSAAVDKFINKDFSSLDINAFSKKGFRIL